MRTLNIVRWATVCLLAVLLVVPAWLVYGGGRNIVVVDGGSMVPTLHLGDVVIIQPIAATDLRPGMIVTAQDGPSTFYTHRIESIDPDGALHLRGDANKYDDLAIRYPTQLLGSVQLVLSPPIGDVLVQLQQWPLRISVLVTIFGLAFLPLRTLSLESARRRADKASTTRTSDDGIPDEFSPNASSVNEYGLPTAEMSLI